MITINLQNIEELIFYNKPLQQSLPELKHIFHAWSIGKQFPKEQHLCRKSIFDFFDLVDDTILLKLKHYFHDEINIVKLDPHLVKTKEFELDCAECELNQCKGYDNWFIWRNDAKLYMNYWR